MTKKLSRREMLKLTASVAAGAILAGCTPTATSTPAATQAPADTAAEPTKAPAAKKPEGKVTLMIGRGEYSEDQQKVFEGENPGITVDFVDSADITRFFAMYAAGSPPDIMRLQAPSIPQFLARKLLYDLTPYFSTSTILKPDDLMPANDYYKADSPLNIGTGKMYGMVKDFSPDLTIFANKKLFEDAGLPVPDDTKALTYQEVMDLSKKLTKKEGDRFLVRGYGYEQAWADRMWMVMLAEKEMKLYSDGFDKINISSNEEAMNAVKWYYDMAKEELVDSALSPSPSGWFGNDFVGAQSAMAQYGFWYSAMAVGEKNQGQVMMLPAPTWSGQRRDPTITATGMIMTAPTKVPDAAWRLFEDYMGGQPAIDRAKSGWGVPALKSMVPMIPQETDYQKQVNKVLQGELALQTAPLQFNPFLGEAQVSTAFNKHREISLKGDTTFEEMVAAVEAEVNTAIKDGISAIMG